MTTGRRRIAVLKPDYPGAGGFERHLTGLLEALARDDAWTFELIPIEVGRVDRSFGIAIDRPIRDRHDEYFLWAALVERVQRLDLSGYDAVLATQPPTYLADHPRKVALFYHHPRQFYDQAELFARSGFVDPEIHRAAVAAVRSVEATAPATVRHWLAGSQTVADRLRRFWSVPDSAISLHSAPPTSTPDSAPAPQPDGPVLTVGRLEWPKRQELVIAAAHRPGLSFELEIVGTGSRLGHVRRLDAALCTDPALAERLDDDQLWRNTGPNTSFPTPRDEPRSGRPSPVRFLGAVSDLERDEAYARCSVVVTPTIDEDYGLTVLEAMARARPVIVCRDGGGLVEFVEHGVNGLVVDPHPTAIARAVAELAADPTRAESLGRAARRTADRVTWDTAVASVADALRLVLDGPTHPDQTGVGDPAPAGRDGLRRD